jgi:hypothetical protein
MFPPFIRGEQVEAVRGSHAQAMMRAQHQLYREAANRLREEKIKARARAEAEARMVGVVRMGTPKMGHARERPNRPAAMPRPPRAKNPAPTGALLLKYRSKIKRAILIQITTNPGASDLEICKAFDVNGFPGLPKTWQRLPGDLSFVQAYKDPGRKHRIEIAISKIRADLRKRELLPGR